MSDSDLYDDDRFGWLDDAECVRRDVPLERMFVAAGHTLAEADARMCREECPVRRQCLILSYTNRSAFQSGFFAGISAGQRKDMDLATALERLDAGTL